jgi:hypothetical protein
MSTAERRCASLGPAEPATAAVIAPARTSSGRSLSSENSEPEAWVAAEGAADCLATAAWVGGEAAWLEGKSGVETALESDTVASLDSSVERSAVETPAAAVGLPPAASKDSPLESAADVRTAISLATRASDAPGWVSG